MSDLIFETTEAPERGDAQVVDDGLDRHNAQAADFSAV